MSSPDQHNTEWILDNLKNRRLSKNRLGRRINVDFIHLELSKRFPSVVTIVDGCQDGWVLKASCFYFEVCKI